MSKEFQKNITTYLVRSGDMQYVMLAWVRAILAVMIVSVACYREVTGVTASEPFYMLVGIVVGMYFEKGTALIKPRSREDRDEANPPPLDADPTYSTLINSTLGFLYGDTSTWCWKAWLSIPHRLSTSFLRGSMTMPWCQASYRTQSPFLASLQGISMSSRKDHLPRP